MKGSGTARMMSNGPCASTSIARVTATAGVRKVSSYVELDGAAWPAGWPAIIELERGRAEPRKSASEPRRALPEEHARDELAARGHADLLEDRLEVILHRPSRQVQPVGHRLGAQPECDKLRHLPLALGEPAGIGDQRREFVRTRGLDHYRDLDPRLLAEHRCAHDEPAPRRGPHSRAGDPAVMRLSGRHRPRLGRDSVHYRRH